MIRNRIKTLKYLLKHKWYVGIECFKHGLYWQGIIHDMSKFKPSEFVPYSKFFNSEFSKYEKYHGHESEEEVNHNFKVAWLSHIHNNKHHWNHWVLINDAEPMETLDMPHKHRLEMMCDWKGAGAAMGFPNTWDNVNSWYLNSKEAITLHPDTRIFVEKFLQDKLTITD